MPRPSPDSDEDDDTAFGGLAPRSGPPAAPRARRPRRWAVWTAVAVGLLLCLLIYLAAAR
jgi:type VI protein secretion system component VasF